MSASTIQPIEDPRLLDFLRDSRSYTDATSGVSERQTHISRVLLTDARALKLKKPVAYDFLDFTTLPKRRAACDAEVRLNRRLAPKVYKGLTCVTQTEHGELEWNGSGEVVEWLVEMTRLPDDASLAAYLTDERLTPGLTKRLAVWLTKFYIDLPPVSLQPEVYRHALVEHITANRSALLQLPDHFADHTVKRVHTAQLRFAHVNSRLLDDRVRDGRIVEGHGDLRPDHIYFLPDPVAIDCIEFNEEFRTVDPLDDLGFLAMECIRHNAAWVGEAIIQQYFMHSGDLHQNGLLEFYETYRACVRMKVGLLRAEKACREVHARAIDEAADYLRVADKISRNLGPPMLIIVRGPSGVGKSTLAKHLADSLGADLLQTDDIRRQLQGNQQTETSEYGTGLYSRENRRKVYERMFDHAARLAAQGVSVVLDGAFLTAELQNRAFEIGCSQNAQTLFVNCWCPPEVAAARIGERRRRGETLSDGTAVIHQQQLQEEATPPPHVRQCRVDTTFALSKQATQVCEALKDDKQHGN